MEIGQGKCLTERAPLLLVFGDLAPRVARLLRLRPDAVARLAFAPREAIHAIALFLHLSPEASGDEARIAAYLADTHPRELLRMSFPDAPARLYRALDRAGDRVEGRQFYERLMAICRSPFAEALLREGPLNEQRLAFYEAVQRSDAFMGSIYSALPEVAFWVESVDSLAAVLRDYGALADGQEALPSSFGIAAVLKRMQQALDAVRAPEPPFTPPPPLRVVWTIGELRKIGREFGNCVAQPLSFSTHHWFDLADGSTVYLAQDDPPLLVAVHRVAPTLWHVNEISGPHNEDLPVGARQVVIDGLKNVGVPLIAMLPSHALSRLYSRAKQGQHNDPDDLGFDEGVEDLIA